MFKQKGCMHTFYYFVKKFKKKDKTVLFFQTIRKMALKHLTDNNRPNLIKVKRDHYSS